MTAVNWLFLIAVLLPMLISLLGMLLYSDSPVGCLFWAMAVFPMWLIALSALNLLHGEGVV